MTDETVSETTETRSRRGIGAFLRRVANAFRRGEPVPANVEQTVTVDPPEQPELSVAVEREAGTAELEIEVAWPDEAGEIETEASASKATFELYEDAGGQWRWRLVHTNGNNIADSAQGYASKQKAQQGLESVKRTAPDAVVVDQSRGETADPEGASEATFELYEDAEGGWRWRLVHTNGNIVADCGHGYASKQKARQGLRSVTENAPGAGLTSSLR